MLKQTGSHRLNWMLYLTPVLIVVSLGAILQMIVLPDIYKGITEWGRLLHLGIWAALMLPMAAYAKRYILMLMIYVAIFVSVGYLPFFCRNECRWWRNCLRVSVWHIMVSFLDVDL